MAIDSETRRLEADGSATHPLVNTVMLVTVYCSLSRSFVTPATACDHSHCTRIELQEEEQRTKARKTQQNTVSTYREQLPRPQIELQKEEQRHRVGCVEGERYVDVAVGRAPVAHIQQAKGEENQSQG